MYFFILILRHRFVYEAIPAKKLNKTTEKNKTTEAQRHRGTEAQRHRGTEAQRKTYMEMEFDD